MRALAVVALLVAPARADSSEDAAERPTHGSFGVGSSLLLAGAQGDHTRGEVEVDLEPHSRFGALIAWRAFDRGHAGTVTAGVVYEAGAARPRLVLDLHGEAGFDLDQRAPVVGGGIRTIIAVGQPLGVALDTGSYLVIDGLDRSRLVISTSASLVASW